MLCGGLVIGDAHGHGKDMLKVCWVVVLCQSFELENGCNGEVYSEDLEQNCLHYRNGTSGRICAHCWQSDI